MENLIGKVKGHLDLINRKASAQKSEDLGTKFKKKRHLLYPLRSCIRCVLGIHQ